MKSTARVNYLGSQGMVQSVSQGAWDFIYRTSTVKDSKWNIGDRCVLPDGRVFRYAKSTSEIKNDWGAKFMDDEFSGYSTISVANAVGDKSISVTAVAHDEVAEDELAGGYVIIFHTGGGGYTQFRGIVGNPAAADGATFTLYLDGPIDHATIAASTGVEVFNNPYAYIGQTAGAARSFAGKAALHIIAASMYFWVQTWGPCWIAPSTTDGSWGTDTYHRAAYWRVDGGIQIDVDLASMDADNTTQYAGFLIGEGYSSGPLLMLQCSV